MSEHESVQHLALPRCFAKQMKLFYTEERLEEAAGGADAVQLHREIANAKRVRGRPPEQRNPTITISDPSALYACGL